MSAETIDDYIKRLNLKNDRIDINTFRKFMDMLDTVLVDEEGNLLGFDEADKAVNLDDLDDEDDDN